MRWLLVASGWKRKSKSARRAADRVHKQRCSPDSSRDSYRKTRDGVDSGKTGEGQAKVSGAFKSREAALESTL